MATMTHSDADRNLWHQGKRHSNENTRETLRRNLQAGNHKAAYSSSAIKCGLPIGRRT